MVAIGIVVVVFVGAVVETHSSRRFLLVEPRAAIHKRIAARIRIVTAHLVAETDGVAHPAEIRIADAHHADHAVGARVARADAERARALLLDIDLHDDRIRLHTRIHLDVDILEEAEVVDALHTAARLIGVERLAGLLAHLAEDDALLGLLVALDLIALQRPLADADRECPILRDVEIRDLGENIAVRAVLLLNRLHILLQGAPVEQLPLLHGHEIHEILRLFDRVAFDAHFLQHGVFQHVIGQHDALGHLFKDRVEIVEVPRRVDRIAILDEHILRQSISDVHGNRLMCRLLRHLGGSYKVDLDDRLAHLCRKPLRHSILTGTRARPRSRTCLCRCRRRLVRQGRSLLCRGFLRRSLRRIAQDGGLRPRHLRSGRRTLMIHWSCGMTLRQSGCGYTDTKCDGKGKSAVLFAVQRRNLLDHTQAICASFTVHHGCTNYSLKIFPPTCIKCCISALGRRDAGACAAGGAALSWTAGAAAGVLCAAAAGVSAPSVTCGGRGAAEATCGAGAGASSTGDCTAGISARSSTAAAGTAAGSCTCAYHSPHSARAMTASAGRRMRARRRRRARRVDVVHASSARASMSFRSPDTSSAPARASSAPASQSRAARMDRLRSSRSLSIALSLPTIILHRSDRIQ